LLHILNIPRSHPPVHCLPMASNLLQLKSEIPSWALKHVTFCPAAQAFFWLLVWLLVCSFDCTTPS
jgi:hypothetical protein